MVNLKLDFVIKNNYPIIRIGQWKWIKIKNECFKLRNCIKKYIYSLQIIDWHLAICHMEDDFLNKSTIISLLEPVGHPTAVVNVLAFWGTFRLCSSNWVLHRYLISSMKQKFQEKN